MAARTTMAVLQLIDARAREPLLTHAERAVVFGAPWLAALPADVRQDLLQACRVRSVRADQPVAAGGAGPALCGLASGALGIRARDCGPDIVDYVPPGTWYADTGVLLGGPAQLAATAHRRATIVSVQAGALRDLARRHPGLYPPLMVLSAGIMARLVRALDELATRSLQVRLALCLLRLAEGFGVAGQEGVRVAITMHQGQLAGLLRASRQRLNLELNALESDGMLRIGPELLVTDVDALRAVARAEPSPKVSARPA